MRRVCRGDGDDRLLAEAVLPLLQSLAQEVDVRPRLRSRFNMPHWFKAQGVTLALTRAPAGALLSTHGASLHLSLVAAPRVPRCRL